MDNKEYTPKQIENADLLAKAISKIPEDRASLFTMMMNTLLLGAEMAENIGNTNETGKPEQDA